MGNETPDFAPPCVVKEATECHVVIKKFCRNLFTDSLQFENWMRVRVIPIEIKWSELRPAQPVARSVASGRLSSTPTVAGLPGLCENFRPTASKS